MTSNYEILLLHHNRELASAVLLQFEQSIINCNGRQSRMKPCVIFHILQSKSIIAQLITDSTIINNDISGLIVSLMNPSLKILQKTTNSMKSCVIFTIKEEFVAFNHPSVVDFASLYLEKWKRNRISFPLCIIHLFDESEASALISTANMKQVTNQSTIWEKNNDVWKGREQSTANAVIAGMYGFYTRFFASIFDDCHHIHLFAGECNSVSLTANNIQFSKMPILMKVFRKIVIAGNHRKILNLTTYSFIQISKKRNEIRSQQSYKKRRGDILLIDSLLESIHGKRPPMKWGLFCERLQLRRNVIREIHCVISPLMLNGKRVMEFLAFLMKQREIQNSRCLLRTSYV